jgi:DNA-directed RNA polymerase specialized sigma54-like protein
MIVRYKRFGHTRISGQFYEMQDVDVAGSSGGVSPEALLEQKKHLLALIQKVGQERFERFFLYREESDTLDAIAQACAVSKEEAKQLQDFVIDMSVQSEFYHPSALQKPNFVRPTLIGRIVRNEDGTYSMSFFSPHLARGMYEIDRNALRRWQKGRRLDRTSAAKLKKYVGLLELSNMKQGAFWRVIDLLLKLHKPYFDTQDASKLAAVSLRKVAQKLQFAPSTISRVMSSKSVLLPWDREVMLADLMPGQRRVVLNILEKILGDGRNETDQALAKRVEEQFQVKVSRRTITACRHLIEKKAAPESGEDAA